MGLVFPLQPDLRRSSPETLVLRSHKSRFGLGGSFLFGGALLGTMYIAASPLFKLFWTEGGVWDQLITIAVVTPIVLYPLLAIACWFYEEKVTCRKDTHGELTVEREEGLPGLRWGRGKREHVSFDAFRVVNYRESRNVAAVRAEAKGKTDRYGTKGHWMLAIGEGDKALLLEKRAKRDDIDWLRATIETYFSPPRV